MNSAGFDVTVTFTRHEQRLPPAEREEKIIIRLSRSSMMFHKTFELTKLTTQIRESHF